jgi:hypothetical protein
MVDGIAVTTPARAVLDVARSLAFEPAVALADAALAKPRRNLPPLATPAELASLLERGRRRPGTAAARRVVAFADGRSGSVGESRSRVAIDAAGLPPPVLQWEVYSASGMFIGRVDFAWPAFRTVAEFDGKVKYGRLLRAGQDPGEAVYQEKLREDALRGEDLRMVRWGGSTSTRSRRQQPDSAAPSAPDLCGRKTSVPPGGERRAGRVVPRKAVYL